MFPLTVDASSVTVPPTLWMPAPSNVAVLLLTVDDRKVIVP